MSTLRSFSHEIIRLPSGLALEASLSTPTTANGTENKLAVCLHPWSWLGGRMNDPVLQTLKNPLLKHGYHVLRYNSRGVGRSSGWPSLSGSQEGKDLHELIEWAMETVTSVSSLAIVGYSHGSLIASLFSPSAMPGIKVSHILLSYPLGPRAWLTAFRGNSYTSTLNALVSNDRANVLVLYGDSDEFTGVKSYDTWAEELKEVTTENGRLNVAKIEGANHFWVSGEPGRKLLEVVDEWLP